MGPKTTISSRIPVFEALLAQQRLGSSGLVRDHRSKEAKSDVGLLLVLAADSRSRSSPDDPYGTYCVPLGHVDRGRSLPTGSHELAISGVIAHPDFYYIFLLVRMPCFHTGLDLSLDFRFKFGRSNRTFSRHGLIIGLPTCFLELCSAFLSRSCSERSQPQL